MKKIILLILMSFISLSGFSQLNEGFEGAPATPDATGAWALPQSTALGLGSWLVRDNRTNSNPNWRSTIVSFPANSGTNCAYVDRENTGPGVLAQEWLITPQITVLANSQLRFFTRQTLQGDLGTRYQVRASSSANQADLSSYTLILADYSEAQLSTLTSNQLDFEEKIINLPFSGARYFAFVKVFTQPEDVTSGDRWLIDDVRLLQRCEDPIAPLGATASATGATLTWSVVTGSTQSQFEVQWGLSGFNLGSGTIVPVTNSSTPRQGVLPVGTLTEGTSYQFYVRAICTLTNSEWIGPFNFNTPPLGSTCAGPKVVPLLPYSDVSNTAIYGNNITSVSPGTGCGANGTYLAGNDVVYTYTPTESGFLNITMNPLGTSSTSIFVYNSCASVGTSCIGGVGNNNANIRSIPSLAVTANVPIYILISSTAATGTFMYNLLIQKVTCPNPINGTATNIGTTTAELTWANGTGSTANSWEIAVQPLGSAIPAGSGVQTNDNTNYLVDNLQAATAYQYWVRADCGNGLFSIWSGPYLFNTSICEVVNQCNYTFSMTDSANNGWNGATMQVKQNGIVVATIGSTFTTGGGPVNITVPMCNNIPFELFWNNGGVNPGQVRVAIRNSFNQTIYALTTASAGLAGSSLYTGTVDCINPVCQSPTGVTVPTATITASSAKINWVSSGVPTIGWNIYVVPSGSAPPALNQTTPYTATPPTASFTIPTGDLNADTPYDVYVQSVCSVNTPSPWTLATTFTTLPTCPKPTLGNTTLITDLSFQVNWTPVGIGTSWQVLVVPSPSTLPLPTTGWIDASTPSLLISALNYPGIAASTKYDIYVRSICQGGTDIGMPAGPITVQTKVCNPISQCNYIFKVSDDFGDGWNGGIMEVRQNGVVVATLTGPTDAQNLAVISVLVPLCTGIPFDLYWSTPGEFPEEMKVSITNTFSQVLFTMGADNENLAGTVLYSDSAADCLFPKCLPPSGLSANPNIDYAALSWNGSTNNVGWDVYYVTTGGTAPTASTIGQLPNLTSPSTTVNNLQAGTTYDYYVRGICAVGSKGDWIGPFTFTTLPTCPQPTGLTYIDTNGNSANLTWTSIGPATSWQIVIQPSGGAVPGAGAGCLVTTLPTATTPYNTSQCAPNLAPGFYEFYVRSNCTSNDLSTWAGPFNFFIATALPVCASVEVNVPSEIIELCPGESCVDLAATFTDSGETTTYSVLPVAFAPPFPFTGGTQVSVNTDDVWSAPAVLPFNFCFFGTNYSSIQVGSNGVLTFTPSSTAAYGCLWDTEPGEIIPNPDFPIRNAIYGVYQDIDPEESTAPLPHSINYQILGTAPCRSFVVNYFQIGLYDCGTSEGLQTSQIVLYETSNIIEVYVKDRTVCDWNDGLGVIGIQNAAGTQAHFPPGRNLGDWEAHNEAWRFTPAGASNVNFSWEKNGATYSNNASINVCVSETTTMTAKAVYTGCGGQQSIKTKDVLLRVNSVTIPPVADVTVCESFTLPALTVGNYFSSPNGVDPITDLTLEQSQTVYIYAQTATTPACSSEESFTVTIQNLVAPELADISECISYTLPPLDAPFNYYNQLGDTTPITGPITASQTVVIAGGNEFCSANSSFVVTIGSVLAVDQPDLVGCTTVTLPQLPANQAYYAQTGGPNAGAPITDLTLEASQTVYIYALSATCTDESSFNVTISNNLVPAFTAIPNLCIGGTPPVLPTSSANGISGTWSPATISTATAGTTEYFFTPSSAFGCAVPGSITVTVEPPVVPTFNPIADLCLNVTAPTLPTTSTNGITGTWSPATISTAAVGTICYTFTPDASQTCVAPTTLCVTVAAQIIPAFSVPARVCRGTVAPVLPPVSNNGITGFWLPATVDMTAPQGVPRIYVFIPDLTPTQLCAISVPVTIYVDDIITPTFTAIADICQNDVAPVLPLLSNNGVSGTWSPTTINTSVTGTSTYTFTPDADEICALVVTLDVNITVPTAPGFTPLITLCSGDTPPALVNISPNGVSGTWSPTAIDNTTSASYTFTPNGAPIAADNLVVNGDFSLGNTGFTTDYANIPDAGQFGVQKAYGIVTNAFDWFFAFSQCHDHTTGTGNMMVADGSTSNGGNDRVWCQTIPVTPGVDYNFSYYLESVSAGTPAVMDVVINGVEIGTGSTNPITCIWEQQSYNWNSGTSTTAEICIYDRTTTSGGNDFAIDDIFFGVLGGQCASSQTINVVVNPKLTPDFAALAPVCSGAAAPVLATTSPNGVTGTWSPSTVSTSADGCYVFTPNAGQCANPVTLCLTVNPVLTPNFAPIAAFCSGDVAPVLPTTSPNGIVGTWNPSTVSNTLSGNYVFTATGDPCANTQTLSIEVVPSFTIKSACLDNSYIVSVVEDLQNVTYSWTYNGQPIANATGKSINVNETGTGAGTYTVTLNNAACSTESHVVNSISCDIQKGISPKGTGGGDGKNDFFDLAGLGVRKLEIFNRYGTQVYTKANYTNEWYGQSDKGEELPDGTYYFVIEYNAAKNPKTGWIYINREQ